jgi:signal transduction histidine kinase
MTSKHPLARRIVIAFVLMTFIVSGAFSLSIVAVVHFIEEHLVSEELYRELNDVLHEDLKTGRSPRLASDTRFYASHLPEYAIPAQFARLEEGFSEVVEGDKAYYAYTREIDGKRYVLIQEQDDFEAHEQILFNVVLAGFIFTVLGAWALGRILSGRVIAPISRLAQQVRHRDQLLSLAPPLAPEYADDEVGQLAAAFDSTLGKLRQSLERERLFTSDVSHELRTPLMVISTSCELLEQAPLEARQHEQLARIERACEEMRELVQTFLQLARGEDNPTDASATASLAQVAQQQCSHWRVLMQEKGLDFQCISEMQDDGCYSATLLGTVMANLLRNALHYTERGQVRLLLDRGGFRVEDSGAGIPVDQQELIFQPFVRGPLARGEGLGLGLSLVKRICSHQDWGIAVHNLSSGGSCFSVRLKQDD